MGIFWLVWGILAAAVLASAGYLVFRRGIVWGGPWSRLLGRLGKGTTWCWKRGTAVVVWSAVKAVLLWRWLANKVLEGLSWAWRQGLVTAIMLAAVLALAVASGVSKIGGFPVLTPLVVLGILGVWVLLGFGVVGRGSVRHVALKVTFGRPTSLVNVGLAYHIRGVQRLWRVPTGQYWWQYVVEGHTQDNWWVKVVARVDFRWPTPTPDYGTLFPFVPDAILNRPQALTWKEASTEDVADWPPQDAFTLLSRAFYRFRKEPITAKCAELQDFFEGATKGALITVLGELSLNDFVSQQEAVEAALKVMVLGERGDPYVESGIPPACLNIRVVLVEPLIEGAKLNLEARARAANERAASRERGIGAGQEHRERQSRYAAAAPDEASRVRALVEAYQQQGVDPTTAAILANAAARGEEFTLEKLMQLAIIRGQMSPNLAAAATQQQSGTP